MNKILLLINATLLVLAFSAMVQTALIGSLRERITELEMRLNHYQATGRPLVIVGD